MEKFSYRGLRRRGFHGYSTYIKFRGRFGFDC